MKMSVLISLGIIVLITVVFFVVEQDESIFQKSDSDIAKYITVNKINENVIVTGLGYDAVTAFSTTAGVVVVDAGISNHLTQKYRDIIDTKFSSDNFKYLINTHAHHDHTGGNQVFADAVITGHINCLPEMREFEKNIEGTESRMLQIAKDYEKDLAELTPDTEEWKEALCQKIRYESAYNDLSDGRVVTYPSLTFEGEEHIACGNMNFDLCYFGKAHSDSDILIHCPEQKILMTGDLFFPGGRPSIGNSDDIDTIRWLTAKNWIEKRIDKIETVIGGHGQIMNIDDLTSFLDYIPEKVNGKI